MREAKAHQQDITPSSLNNTDATLTAINYTIFDEVTLEPIIASFDGTFEWFLGTGTVLKNSSFDEEVVRHEYNYFTTKVPNSSVLLCSTIL